MSSDVNRREDTDNVTTIDYHTIYWRSITQIVQHSCTVRLSVIGPCTAWLALLTEIAYRFNSPSLQHSITLVGPMQVSAHPSAHPKAVIADLTKVPA